MLIDQSIIKDENFGTSCVYASYLSWEGWFYNQDREFQELNMVKDTMRPVPILLVPEMGKSIENEIEFSEGTYGKGVMF